MENNPLGFSQRGFSREGVKRAPSREGQQTPEVRRKIPSQTGLTVSGQNFFNTQSDARSGTEDLMLASLNIAIDETAFVSTTKADLLQLQEEINKMDIDGKIRSTNPSNILKKNHIYAMAKFLQRYNSSNIKSLLDKRISHASNFDTEDLLKFMNVRSESEGLRKLFKMLGVFDLMMVKLTEFHAVTFLKYDHVFENLRKQFGGLPSSKLPGMDSGITISRFQIDLANLDRMVELYNYVSKLSQQSKTGGGSDSSLTKLDKQGSKGPDSLTKVEGDNEALKGIQSVEELYTALRNGEKLGFSNSLVSSLIELVETSMEGKARENSLEKKIKSLEKELSAKLAGGKDSDLVSELQRKVDQLTRDSEGLRKELEQSFTKELKEKTRKLEYQLEVKDDDIRKLKADLEKAQKNVSTPAPSTGATKDEVFNTDYYIKLVKQIEENYNTKAKDVEEDNHKKEKELVTLRIKLETTEREKEELAARLTRLENQEERDARLRLKGDDQSFELALREQFNAMKEGFEYKIKSLTTELQSTKKEKSLEVLEVRKELQREKENRELLLRKLQIYTKN